MLTFWIWASQSGDKKFTGISKERTISIFRIEE
jgi:hypothetical protein